MVKGTRDLMMMKNNRFYTFLSIIILLHLPHLSMKAQEKNVQPAPATVSKKLFTLEDLNFGGNNYRNLLPENLWLTWWGDQLMYQDAEEGGLVTIEKGKNKNSQAQAANNKRTTLFTLKEVGNDFHSAFSAQYPYPAQPLVLLKNSQRRILFDWTQKKIAWQQTCKDETNSDWNSKSRAVAYVKEHQLYVRTADDKEFQLTTDGSREIVYGQSVHRNEFGIEKGTFWSPDGQRLAFYRMEQSKVSDYPQVDIFPRVATYEPDKYPMAGETSHQVTIGVYDLTTGSTTYLNTPVSADWAAVTYTPADNKPVYFSNIAWSPDGEEIYLYELNRDQNDCRLVCYDAKTGQRKAEVYRETNDKYVEPQHPIQFLPWNKDQFILQSQRDGYNHLYLYNKEEKLLKQLTSGSWVVLDVLGFNQKQKSILITSNEAHPLQRNTYAVSVKNGQRTLLDNGRGSHHAVLSEGGRLFYDKYTEPDVPRNIDLVDISNRSARTTRLLTAADPWKEYVQPIFESGTIKAADGETDLFFRMIKPHDFDTKKKYPTVVYVYGGPHAHNVEAGWHWYSRSWETYMAQKGYIVFILDNRGSENRGRDFEQATFRQLGQVEMQDQMQGVDYLRSLPYIDTDRLGVHGWSFGGFMTISLMLNYPDVFKVGVAGGPVIDWKWYEVMYGERYMDTPQQNAEGYEKTSLLAKAGNLKGKLQIITGYNDNTVVPQHCLSFLDACIKAGTQPDFFAYPGEEHNMRGHASVHLHERITQYFEDYLKK
jgi:dipeptidyl-peptidase-4